jgi:hypothetical protein
VCSLDAERVTEQNASRAPFFADGGHMKLSDSLSDGFGYRRHGGMKQEARSAVKVI